MTREWQPGDVAMASHPEVDPFLVVRTFGGSSGDYWSAPHGWPKTAGVGSYFCDYRPLLVIDPEDRGQVERLRRALHAVEVGEGEKAQWEHQFPTWREHEVDKAQAALRSLIAPPKPAEPQGLGAVVEDAEGERWINFRAGSHHVRPWVRHFSGSEHWADWCDIAAVRVLSEGVSDA